MGSFFARMPIPPVERMKGLKRFLTAFLALCLTIGLFPAAALAEFDPESVSTPYIALMDADTGTLLYAKNEHDQAFPASTTKIMTAILAIENGNLDEEVTVGSSVEEKGSQMEISPGEKLTLRDLLYGMMLVSGNDASRAIAEHIAGSQEAFAELMNEKAKLLGMSDSHFVKPNGLHKDDHYSTAYDMALLTQYAMKNATFREIVDATTYQVDPTNKDRDGYLLENTNRLIHTPEGDSTSYEYKYATGVKTGDTDQAGRCLVASASKDGVNLILVLFGDKEKYDRFENASQFFNWGFSNYATITPSELGLQTTLAKTVSNCSFDDVENGNLTVNIDFSGKKISGLRSYIDELKANAASITCEETLDRALTAPVASGEVLGTVAYKYNGQTLFTANMIASRAVAEIGVTTSDNPSPSPFLIDPSQTRNTNAGSWIFWVILLVAILLIFVALRVLAIRKARKRIARRRRMAYRVYRR